MTVCLEEKYCTKCNLTRPLHLFCNSTFDQQTWWSLIYPLLFEVWFCLSEASYPALFSNFLSSYHIQFSVFLPSSINENASGWTLGHIISTPHSSQACHNRSEEVVLCSFWEWVWLTELGCAHCDTALRYYLEYLRLFVLKSKVTHLIRGGCIGTRSITEEDTQYSLQWYLMKTYQSQRQLEQGWELTGLVWRCRGQSPADHQMKYW